MPATPATPTPPLETGLALLRPYWQRKVRSVMGTQPTGMGGRGRKSAVRTQSQFLHRRCPGRPRAGGPCARAGPLVMHIPPFLPPQPPPPIPTKANLRASLQRASLRQASVRLGGAVLTGGAHARFEAPPQATEATPGPPSPIQRLLSAHDLGQAAARLSSERAQGASSRGAIIS